MKMKNNLFTSHLSYIIIIMCVVLSFSVSGYGQIFGNKQFSETEPTIDATPKYEEGLIVFTLDIGDSAHITDLKNNFFSIELDKNEFIKIQNVVFPKGVPYEEEIVFKGKFDVNVFVRQLKPVKAPVTLKFKVNYQVCQEKPTQLCYAPSGKDVDIAIQKDFKGKAETPQTVVNPSTTATDTKTTPAVDTTTGTENIQVKPVEPSTSPVQSQTVTPVAGKDSETSRTGKLKPGNWKLMFVIAFVLIALSVFLGLSKALKEDDELWVKFTKAALLIVFIIGAYLFITALDISYSPAKYSEQQAHHSTLNWMSNLEEAKVLAKKENKQLFLDTAAEWCAACKELEKYTFSAPEVENVLKNYILVRIDFTKKTEENEMFRSKFNIIGMPTLILMDKDGKELKRDSGFMEKDKFLGFLGNSSGLFDSLVARLKKELETKSIVLFLLVFGLGFLTSLTPCVYPVIPIVMGYIGTRSGNKKLKGFYLSIFFVLGLALVYSILGVAAAGSGSMMGASFQNPIVVIIISAIFIVMGLSLAGLFEIPVPSSISSKVQSSSGRGEVIGALIVGGVSGVIAAPCVGPVLIALLSWISQTKNLGLGFLLTFVFSLGMGVIFLLVGTFSGIVSAMPKGGNWMNYVKYFFAIVLIAGGIYFVSTVIPGWISLLLWGIFLVACSIFIGLHTSLEEYTFKQKLYKFIVVLVFLLGLFMLTKSIETKFFTYSPEVVELNTKI